MPHTPGPWKARGSDVLLANVVQAGGYGWHVAHVFGDDKDQREANANLIAAAPMLLEMCKVMLTHLEANAAHQPAENFHRKLHAAIAAAEGGEDNA